MTESCNVASLVSKINRLAELHYVSLEEKLFLQQLIEKYVFMQHLLEKHVFVNNESVRTSEKPRVLKKKSVLKTKSVNRWGRSKTPERALSDQIGKKLRHHPDAVMKKKHFMNWIESLNIPYEIVEEFIDRGRIEVLDDGNLFKLINLSTLVRMWSGVPAGELAKYLHCSVSSIYNHRGADEAIDV